MRHLSSITYGLLSGRRGQATLSLVFLVGGISIAVGIGLAFLVISFTNSAFSYQAANRALAVASAGANDALLQLARNNSFLTSFTPTVPNDITGYCVSGGDASQFCEDTGSAYVTVTPTTTAPGMIVITSRAAVSSNIRKIEVLASISSTTQVSVLSWRLLQLSLSGIVGPGGEHFPTPPQH